MQDSAIPTNIVPKFSDELPCSKYHGESALTRLTQSDLDDLKNPPFTKGADMAYVRHALGFLKPDDELVAIMSTSFQTGATQRPQQFKELMLLAEARVTPIEKGVLKASGTDVSTVQIHVRMDRLLEALEDRKESGEEYGLDLERAWKARNEAIELIERQPKFASLRR